MKDTWGISWFICSLLTDCLSVHSLDIHLCRWLVIYLARLMTSCRRFALHKNKLCMGDSYQLPHLTPEVFFHGLENQAHVGHVAKAQCLHIGHDSPPPPSTQPNRNISKCSILTTSYRNVACDPRFLWSV